MLKVPYKNPINCPHCGIEQVAYSDATDEGKRPKTGDICICSTCAGVGEYRIFKGEIELVKADEQRVLRDFGPEQLALIHQIRQNCLRNDPRSTCN